MMREMIITVPFGCGKNRPSEELTDKHVKPARFEGPIVNAVVHQDAQRVQARSDQHNADDINQRVEEEDARSTRSRRHTRPGPRRKQSRSAS